MESFFKSNISFALDPLSWFFIAVILLISIPAGLYSIGYLRTGYSRARIIYNWLLFFAFLVSMVLVVTVSNCLAFLAAWELMSLVSFFFVVFDWRQEKSVNAGLIYLVMTHVGTAFLTAAFLLFYTQAHSFNFMVIKEAARIMPATLKNTIFLFLLIGFGTKAGLVPVHIWLPDAHPQAPSHVSGIMSGVMIKTAIYGLIRFIIGILGIESLWWPETLLALAAVSCLAGVIYALMESDLKRLLAYSSVENMGIILFGAAGAMLFLKINMPVLAVFSLTAGFYHLINHAIFKGLLFLCAGSVYQATGTRNMEKLGGLIKTMPVTAFSFLIGSMAISALPPLNGFVSEWLTLQSFFSGLLFADSAGIKILMGLSAAVLALTGGLAAACFVKAFGITFLALPRSPKAQKAREVDWSMKSAMIVLSALAILFGIFCGAILKYLVWTAGYALGVDTAGMHFSLGVFTLRPAGVSNGVYLSPALLLFCLLSLAAAGAIGLLFKRRAPKTYHSWDCGYYKLDARNEYKATPFSKPFRIAFSFFLLPYKRIEKVRDSFYHVRSFRYETMTTPIFKKYMYDSVMALILGAAKFMRKIQPGSIHLYLFYIFATILTLIIFINKI